VRPFTVAKARVAWLRWIASVTSGEMGPIERRTSALASITEPNASKIAIARS
jgi:hypothetical protein